MLWKKLSILTVLFHLIVLSILIAQCNIWYNFGIKICIIDCDSKDWVTFRYWLCKSRSVLWRYLRILNKTGGEIKKQYLCNFYIIKINIYPASSITSVFWGNNLNKSFLLFYLSNIPSILNKNYYFNLFNEKLKNYECKIFFNTYL